VNNTLCFNFNSIENFKCWSEFDIFYQASQSINYISRVVQFLVTVIVLRTSFGCYYAVSNFVVANLVFVVSSNISCYIFAAVHIW
jgi:hypothetical protein